MATPEEARTWLAHALEDTELAHHGILGQKWGVRHDTASTGRKSSASTSSPKTKATVQKVAHKSTSKPTAKKPVDVSTTKDTKLTAGDIVGLGVVGLVLAPVGISAAQAGVGAVGAPLKVGGVLKDVKKIQENTAAIDHAKDFLNSKVDTSLPANTVFHRVASYAETEVNAPKYATYLESDVLHYRQTWITPGRSSLNKHYVTKMEALKPVTIASPHSVLQTLEKNLHTVLTDGETLAQKFEKVAPPLTYPTNKGANGLLKSWSEVEPSLLANYIVGHNRAEVWGDDVGKATSEIMQKAGYGAVTDINNTGSMSRKHAVIVLDKTAFKVTSSKLTQAERAAAGLAKSRLAKTAAKTAATPAGKAATVARVSSALAGMNATLNGSQKVGQVVAKVAKISITKL